MKVGIVTCQDVPHLPVSERPVIPCLEARGLDVELVIWNDKLVDWQRFDFLIIRSVWDYHRHPVAFSNWLDDLEQLSIQTLNPIDIIRENMHKFYLQKLGLKGIEIVSTLFIKKSESLDFNLIGNKNWEHIVIKPAISASAYLTEKFSIDEKSKIESTYAEVIPEKDLLVQKYMSEIASFGELSIMFF